MEASHPEQGTLHAWVEGELDGAEHERIEAHLAGCARCRKAVAEARGLIAGASRIVAALDGAPAGVVPSRRRFGAPRPRFAPARWAAAAAVLLFAATSVVVSREFTSRGIGFPTAANETAAPSEDRFAGTPAMATAAGPQQVPETIATVPEARRSAAPSAREPITPRPTEPARGREVRDGRAAAVDETRRFSLSAETVATAGRVTNEGDFAGRRVAGQAPGQIATTAPAISAPPPSAPPPVPPAPAEPRPSFERSQRISAEPLGETVITGAAADAVGSRSSRVVRVVRYEARPGVIVTLTEYEQPPRSDQPKIVLRGGARPQAAAAPPEVRELSGRSSIENAYMWQHPDRGRTYVLRGPLPRAELESLARRLSELKVVR